MTGCLVPWEIAWFLAHGQLLRARRCGDCGATKSPEFNAGPVQTRIYPVAEIASVFDPYFRLKRWEGLGIAVPPSYVDHWARRFPRTTNALGAVDWLIGQLPLFRGLANGVLLEFERR